MVGLQPGTQSAGRGSGCHGTPDAHVGRITCRGGHALDGSGVTLLGSQGTKYREPVLLPITMAASGCQELRSSSAHEGLEGQLAGAVASRGFRYLGGAGHKRWVLFV